VPIPANRSPAGLCLSGYTVKATDARSAIIVTLDTAEEGRGKHADGKGRICPPSRGNIGETPKAQEFLILLGFPGRFMREISKETAAPILQ
jgi:hypothetical protein